MISKYLNQFHLILFLSAQYSSGGTEKPFN